MNRRVAIPVPCLLLAAVPVALAAWAAPASAQVTGRIIDGTFFLPLPGARVSLQTTSQVTVSAADGTFSLPGATGTDLVIVAARKGFFNAADTVSSPASAVIIPVYPVPQVDDTSYVFNDPGACGACHDQQALQWANTPMALSGQNLWMYDVYNGSGTAGGSGGFVYTRDSVHAVTQPNADCASCHQPESWIKQPFRAVEDINSLSINALHGVSCDACHKIADIDETKLNFPGVFPGAVTVTRPSAATGQIQYGVLDASFSILSFMRPSYQPQLPAEMCAACHQDKNDPDEDGDYEEANGVISEPTYGEWEASPYGDPGSPLFATCVECHMPSYGAIHVCNVEPPDRDPETIRSHAILGTTAEFLENAVTLSIDGAVAGDSLAVQVTITNDLTGHHVPTGVTVRNMILLVESWREDDGTPLASGGTQVVHDLGGVGDPAQGYYAGLPGKLFANVTEDGSGQSPAFFTEAVGVVFDTRIPALASDVTSYSFALPGGGGTIRARARLIYRRAFRDLVDAKGWTVDGQGNPLEDVAAPYFGHLMEEAEWSTVVGTGVEPIAIADASGPILFQNRPNPARVNTSIRFRLPAPSDVKLAVYDLQGRRVATLLDGPRAGGDHGVLWSGRDDRGKTVTAGVYLYRLEANGAEVDSRRMTWIR